MEKEGKNIADPSRCLPDLTELLPKDLGDLASVSVNSASKIEDSFALYDIEAEKVIAKFGGVPKNHKGHMLRASRPKARDFLWQNVPVQIGKKFTHYTEARDSITAHFEDGSSVTGTILVGADGSRSKIRAQMLGAAGPHVELSQWQPILAELDLPKEQFLALQAIGTSAIAAAYKDVMRFVWCVREAQSDGIGLCYWALIWRTEDPVAEAAWLETSSSAAKLEKAKEITKLLPPFLKTIIDQTDVEGMSPGPILFREFVPPSALPRGRATLVGDAAHTMLPLRGAGANTACKDACDLARILIKGQAEDDSVEWMLKQYESIMLPRGQSAVLDSRRAGDGIPTAADITARNGSKA